MAYGEGKATLGGAAAGAAKGAAMGSAIPIIGTGVGALIGGIAGGIKGFKEKRQSNIGDRQEATADRRQRREQHLNQRELDRAARRNKLEFNIGDDSLISQNPQTNGTGGGNATFAPQGFDTMSAVSDPNINTAGSLFSKPVPPPMDDVQKSLQQQITPVT